MDADKYVKYNPGEYVFNEGDAGKIMYVLVSGVIELRKKIGQGEQLLAVIDKPNEFFGEMALIDDSTRSAAAVAVEQTTLIHIEEDIFEKMILSNGKFAFKIIQVLSERIRQSNRQISELIQENPRERFISNMVEYAADNGEKLYNKGTKVNVAALSEWMNSRAGFSAQDIKNHLFKLIQKKEITYASVSTQSKEDIILSLSFMIHHTQK